jgi:hypothetical protein
MTTTNPAPTTARTPIAKAARRAVEAYRAHIAARDISRSLSEQWATREEADRAVDALAAALDAERPPSTEHQASRREWVPR